MILPLNELTRETRLVLRYMHPGERRAVLRWAHQAMTDITFSVGIRLLVWPSAVEGAVLGWRMASVDRLGGRFDCGGLGYADDDGNEIVDRVYSDVVCLKCKHPPCPACGSWCHRELEPVGVQDPYDCCNYECVYPHPPRFTIENGSPWKDEP